MPKILYDRRNCDGFLVCMQMDPDDFDETEDEGLTKARLRGAKEIEPGLWEKEIPEEQVEDAIQAASGCPSDVIKVLDDDGQVLEGPKELPIEA